MAVYENSCTVIGQDMTVYDGFLTEHEHCIMVQNAVVIGTCLHILFESSFVPCCTHRLLALLKGADLLRSTLGQAQTTLLKFILSPLLGQRARAARCWPYAARTARATRCPHRPWAQCSDCPCRQRAPAPQAPAPPTVTGAAGEFAFESRARAPSILRIMMSL
jgi:hypothetical protein